MAKGYELSKVVAASLSPEQGIRVLQDLHKQGRALLSKRPLDMDEVYAWVSKGRELLIRCLGSDSKNVSEFEFAGANSWPENQSEQAWDALHAKTLNYQLKLLTSSIELLEIEAYAGGHGLHTNSENIKRATTFSWSTDETKLRAIKLLAFCRSLRSALSSLTSRPTREEPL